MLCERYQGYTFELLAEENEDQIRAKLRHIEKYPTPCYRPVVWKGDK